jgi:hypothetical protein
MKTQPGMHQDKIKEKQFQSKRITTGMLTLPLT